MYVCMLIYPTKGGKGMCVCVCVLSSSVCMHVSMQWNVQ